MLVYAAVLVTTDVVASVMLLLARLLPVLAAAGALLAAGTVNAQEAGAAAPPDAWRTRPRVHPTDDGKGPVTAPEEARGDLTPRATEPEDAALGAPRVILALPAMVIRIVYLPIEGALYVLGRYHVIDHVIDFLHNDDRTAGVIPLFTFLGDQGVTVGFSAFHRGLGKHGESISLSGRFGGQYVQSYGLAFAAPHVAGTPFNVEVATRYDVEPHPRFFGYGGGDLESAPTAPADPREVNTQATFHQRRALVRARAGGWIVDEVNLGGEGVLTSRSFGTKPGNESVPSIEDAYDTSKLVGFDHGYALVEALVDLRVDTRRPAGATASGIYLHAFGGGVPPQNELGYVHYGGEVTGFIDLYKGDRVIALRAVHEAVWGSDDAIPFTEMPRLGGPSRLRGFQSDRFRDKHTAVLTASYHYPIHEYVAGSLFVDLGSVGEDYEDLATPRNFRVGGGGGLLFRSRDSKLFSFQLAYGDSLQLVFTSDPLVTFDTHTEQL